jgi:hypothetical protein
MQKRAEKRGAKHFVAHHVVQKQQVHSAPCDVQTFDLNGGCKRKHLCFLAKICMRCGSPQAISG